MFDMCGAILLVDNSDMFWYISLTSITCIVEQYQDRSITMVDFSILHRYVLHAQSISAVQSK